MILGIFTFEVKTIRSVRVIFHIHHILIHQSEKFSINSTSDSVGEKFTLLIQYKSLKDGNLS